MGPLRELLLHWRVTRPHTIARRYFVVNGFDGALTMLGLISGFYFSGETANGVVINACLGAAVALGTSGISSAYISETAERKQQLKELENAMVSDLSGSTHGRAARTIPLLIALVNGMAPMLISLVIMTPLWLAAALPAAFNALQVSMMTAFAVIFLLGVFLGRVSGKFWLFSGIRAMLIAAFTCLIILAVTRA